MKKAIIAASMIFLSGCASQDYQAYLNAKTQVASAPQRVIAEMGDVKVYDQRTPELSPPQQPFWVSLLTTAITMTGQVVLGVSGNDTQARIVQALASGIGSSYSSYQANVTTTNTATNRNPRL